MSEPQQTNGRTVACGTAVAIGLAGGVGVGIAAGNLATGIGVGLALGIAAGNLAQLALGARSVVQTGRLRPVRAPGFEPGTSRPRDSSAFAPGHPGRP